MHIYCCILTNLNFLHLSPFSVQFSSVQLLSRVWLFATPWTATHQASLSITIEFPQTYVHWVYDAIQSSHPLLSPSLAFNLSQHQGHFQRVSSLQHVAKVLELQLQHSPSILLMSNHFNASFMYQSSLYHWKLCIVILKLIFIFMDSTLLQDSLCFFFYKPSLYFKQMYGASQMLGWWDLQQRKHCPQDSQLGGGREHISNRPLKVKGLEVFVG